MKNNAKRLLSILLAALLCVGMIVPAFATDADHDHEETVCTTKHIAENGTEVETKAPVCGNYGYTIYTCNDCGEHFLDNIVKPTGTHEVDFDTVLVEAVEATCTTAGTAAGYACKNCDSMVDAEANTVTAADLVIEALGHDIEGVTAEVVNGKEYFTCKTCGEKIPGEQVSCPDGKHTWKDRPTDITPAESEEVDGEATYECIKCAAVKKVPVKWNHYCSENLVHVEAVVPEHCEAKGNIEYWYCSVCGEKYADEAATEVVENVENDGKHTFENEPTVIEATCTTYGFKFYACTVCGTIDDSKTEKIDPLGHTPALDEDGNPIYVENEAGYAPTCEKDGYTGSYTCGRKGCGAKIEGETIPATGHVEVEVTVGATCSIYAYTFKYCSNENCTYEAVETVDGYNVTVEGAAVNYVPESLVVDVEGGYNTAHDTVDGLVEQIIVAPTCTEKGSKYYYCPNCNYETAIEVIPALGHDFDATIKENIITVNSTLSCTTDHVVTVKCAAEGCAVTEKVTLATKTGHDIEDAELVKVNPTCNTKGKTYKVCANEGCGAKVDVVVEGFEYDFVFDLEKYYNTVEDALKDHAGLVTAEGEHEIDRLGSCELVGLYRYNCTDCGKAVLIKIDGTGDGHVADENVTTFEDGTAFVGASDATCTEKGYTGDFYCSSCKQYFKGVETPALGHNVVDVTGTDATCTEVGYTTGKKCDREGCDYVEEAVEEIPALGHDWVVGEDGTYTCSRCEFTCDHTNAVADNKHAIPDCDDYGFVFFTCDCGYEYITDYKAELGHTDGEAVVVDPTCTEKGSSKVYCTVCGELTAEEVIPATGHQNEAGETIVESCDDETEDRFCVNCETEISKDCTDVTTSTVAPTCGEYGYVIEICNVCGKNKVEIDDTLEPTEKHTMVMDEDRIIQVATPTVPGKAVYVCSVCGFEDEGEYKVSGTAFNVTVENNIVAGSDYVVGSEVKVTVALDTSAIEAWGLKLDLFYKGATFKKAVIGETFANATGKFGTTVVNNVVGNITSVALLATANNTAENKMQNVALEGSVVVIELYFEITKANAEFTAAGEILAVDQTAIEAEGDVETIDAGKLLDINADGVVDLVDLNTVMALFTDSYTVGEGEDAELVEYLTAADANLNGAIDVEDVKTIMTAILKGKG